VRLVMLGVHDLADGWPLAKPTFHQN